LSGLSLTPRNGSRFAWVRRHSASSTFGIFDVFPNETGRQAHLSGKVAADLEARASELFAQPPLIERLDIMAAKLAQSEKVASNGNEEKIPMQVGSELRIRNSGEIVIDNPELELARTPMLQMRRWSIGSSKPGRTHSTTSRSSREPSAPEESPPQ
jgi:hypothetical protein